MVNTADTTTGADYHVLGSTENTPLNAGRHSSGSTDSRMDWTMGRASEMRLYLTLLGMGLASLLPWNLFICASEFFHYQFAGSVYESTFQNSFSVTYTVMNFMSCLYAMVTVTRSNPNRRIVYGLIINTAVYSVGVLMPFMEKFRGTISFYIALAQLVVSAIASGLILNSIFAIVSHFPSSNAEGMLSGQAIAGMIASFAQLVTAYVVAPPTGAAIGSTNAEASSGLLTRTVAYFAFATTVNIMLSFAFWSISRDPYYQARSKLAIGPEYLSYGSDDGDGDSEIVPTTPLPTLPDLGLFKRTFAQISGHVYASTACFALTLAVFPSTTALVDSVSGFKLLTEWHFFLYTTGDFLGRRTAPSIPITQGSTLVLLSLTRILFVPAFFACNVVFSVWYTWIKSDAVFLAMVLLLGYSTGLISTRAAMVAPGLTDQPSIAGSIMAISVGTGLALGSIFSWLVRSIGCLCSPF
ncbi:hypothetical protein GGI11_002695 [Coemansia sp. RSA 2049]|nr:hypothetical protein GGI11_002695 [Coemansia sp. RSA 2049]KAJ2610007.1 hypothetical protein EV177_004185 [Coemansia sp. RSA 1804]